MDPAGDGETATFERTFTVADVEEFGKLPGDDRARYTELEEGSRVMVRGLLRATMPTKCGADLEMLADTLDPEFHRPVYTGERITCPSTVTDVVEREDRYEVAGDTVRENEAGEAVLTVDRDGVVWKATDPVAAPAGVNRVGRGRW